METNEFNTVVRTISRYQYQHLLPCTRILCSWSSRRTFSSTFFLRTAIAIAGKSVRIAILSSLFRNSWAWHEIALIMASRSSVSIGGRVTQISGTTNGSLWAFSSIQLMRRFLASCFSGAMSNLSAAIKTPRLFHKTAWESSSSTEPGFLSSMSGMPVSS